MKLAALGAILVSLTASQNGAAPKCTAASKGVVWNFGTYEKPDVRECDGISFVPFQVACTPSAASAEGAKKLKNVCEQSCRSTQLSCENGCLNQLMVQSCKEDCRRTEVQCATRC